MIRNILLPIDGSVSSLNAVQYVIKQWDDQQPQHLHLLNVRLPALSAVTGTDAEMQSEWQQEGMLALASAGKLLDHYAIPYQKHVLTGNPVEVITRFANDHAIDQIIVGCAHKSAQAHMADGTTAAALMRQTRVPVLIIPDEIPLKPGQRPEHHALIRRYLRHGMLTQMGVFEALARLGSFTRAGEELSMAQSTVSVQMRKLSETIGMRLLEQHGKHIRLTAAGRELYAVCHNIFDQLGAMHALFASMRAANEQRLRLAVTESGKYFATSLLGRFCQQFPDVDVTLHTASRQHLLQRMRENMDDLYLMALPPGIKGWMVRCVGSSELVVVARHDHPLAQRPQVSLPELAQQAFLMREPESGMRKLAEQEFARHGLRLRVRMEFNSDEAIRQGVLQGLGLAVLFKDAVHPQEDGQRLVILPVEGFPHRHAWHLAHPQQPRLSSSVQSFVDYASTCDQNGPDFSDGER